MDTYAEIPYQSTPFAETHPAHLAPLARLFGHPAVDPGQCRVLELGCAAGGNLIPMAWQLPHSEFLGIELSAPQAAEGAARIQRLGLRNVEVRQGDLMALDDGLGQFDYIIAHGLYSWVPAAVREGILALCRRHLTPHGLAYISYNTLPGWRWRGQLREMLLYHCRDATGPRARLERAYQLLELLRINYQEGSGPEATYLRAEVERLLARHPSYLYHEYLETDNHPCLFRDFVSAARGHGLDYLTDIELASLFPSTLPEPVAAWVEGLDDPIEVWQYLDLFGQRTFRQSLLCHAEVPHERDVELERFAEFAVASDLRPPKKLDLKRARPTPFSGSDGVPRTIHHPLTQAALAELAQHYPACLSLGELYELASRRVTAAGNAGAAQEGFHLLHELFSLYAHQLITARLTPHAVGNQPGPRPQLLAPLLSDARAGLDHLVGLHHSTLTLDPFGSLLAAQLDGSLTRDELVATLCARMPELAATRALLTAEQLADPKRLARLVERNCDQLLALFARQGLLSA